MISQVLKEWQVRYGLRQPKRDRWCVVSQVTKTWHVKYGFTDDQNMINEIHVASQVTKMWQVRRDFTCAQSMTGAMRFHGCSQEDLDVVLQGTQSVWQVRNGFSGDPNMALTGMIWFDRLLIAWSRTWRRERRCWRTLGRTYHRKGRNLWTVSRKRESRRCWWWTVTLLQIIIVIPVMMIIIKVRLVMLMMMIIEMIGLLFLMIIFIVIMNSFVMLYQHCLEITVLVGWALNTNN